MHSVIAQEGLGYAGRPQCKQGTNQPVLLLDQAGFPPGNPEQNMAYHAGSVRCGWSAGNVSPSLSSVVFALCIVGMFGMDDEFCGEAVPYFIAEAQSHRAGTYPIQELIVQHYR